MSNLMPTGEPSIPTLMGEIEALKREMRALWNRKQGEATPKLKKRELVFSFAGEPDTDTASPPYVIPFFSGTLMGVRITASKAGSGASKVAVYINGSLQETVTLDGGDVIEYEDDVMLDLEEDDLVQVKFTQVGNGLENPVIQILMSVDQADS